MRTRIYYRGPDATVTHDLFVWHSAPATLSFSVGDLQDVIRTQAPAQVRPYAPHLAAAALLAVVAVWTVADHPALYAAGLLAVAVPTVATLWREPGRRELRARYRGAEVLLYSSTDETRFNQVIRALRRAMEDERRARGGFGLAAA